MGLGGDDAETTSESYTINIPQSVWLIVLLANSLSLSYIYIYIYIYQTECETTCFDPAESQCREAIGFIYRGLYNKISRQQCRVLTSRGQQGHNVLHSQSTRLAGLNSKGEAGTVSKCYQTISIYSLGVEGDTIYSIYQSSYLRPGVNREKSDRR